MRAVLVDVVVRDRRGQPVRDLTQADFEVLEDGVPQTIGSFTPVFESAPAPVAGGATAPRSRSAQPRTRAHRRRRHGPTVTALVFDRLTPEAQRLAVQAAQGYSATKEERRTTSAFRHGSGADAVRAVHAQREHAAPGADEGGRARARRRSTAPSGSSQGRRRPAAASGSADRGECRGGRRPRRERGDGHAPGAAQLAQMESQMIRDFDAMERDQQGYSTTNGLFAIISALRKLPGTKEPRPLLGRPGDSSGGAAPVPRRHRRREPGQREHLHDGRGRPARRERAGEDSRPGEPGRPDLASTPPTRAPAGDEPLTKALEKNEDVLRQDPA